MSIASIEVKPILVGMGEIKIAQHPEHLASVLGSCIGVAIFHAREEIGALAHVMLPESAGRDGPAGKFADTAIVGVLEILRERGVRKHGLAAKLSGGSNMFGNSGPMQIGLANAEAVRVELRKNGIPVMGEDIGGTAGRRVKLDCQTGLLTVARMGAEDLIL